MLRIETQDYDVFFLCFSSCANAFAFLLVSSYHCYYLQHYQNDFTGVFYVKLFRSLTFLCLFKIEEGLQVETNKKKAADKRLDD